MNEQSSSEHDQQPIRPPLPEITGAELLSGLAPDGFIGSAPVPWRCAICECVIIPGEVHKHGRLTTGGR